jgi:RNA polymerase sigma-70 factor (ECF subfamily)
MQNESLQYLRKKKLLLDFDDIKEEQIDTDNSEDEDSFKKVPRDVLFSFISELPDGYRTIFNMYVFEKYSHKQIAQELGVKEKTSASQLVRAKSKLIEKINDYLKKEER